MSEEEITSMLAQVLSEVRWTDPIVAAIGDVWIEEFKELRDVWRLDLAVPANGDT